MIDSRTTPVAVHLILQLGYFKAKHQFFQYNHEAVHDDLRHILGRYFPGTDLTAVNMPSRPTQYALQQSILELLGFRLCDNALRAELERRAQRTAMLSTQPIYILRESLQYLNQQHLVAPAYTFLQDMVGMVVTGERKRLTCLLDDALTSEIRDQLDTLLKTGESACSLDTFLQAPVSPPRVGDITRRWSSSTPSTSYNGWLPRRPGCICCVLPLTASGRSTTT